MQLALLPRLAPLQLRRLSLVPRPRPHPPPSSPQLLLKCSVDEAPHGKGLVLLPCCRTQACCGSWVSALGGGFRMATHQPSLTPPPSSPPVPTELVATSEATRADDGRQLAPTRLRTSQSTPTGLCLSFFFCSTADALPLLVKNARSPDANFQCPGKASTTPAAPTPTPAPATVE
jgi:hypothetical protein